MLDKRSMWRLWQLSYLVPRPHYCTRPMRFGSRGPFVSETSPKFVNWEGLGLGIQLSLDEQNRELYQRQRRRQRERQNNNFARAEHFFCTTSTWNSLVRCFMADVNSPRRILSSLSKLGFGLQEFNARKILLYLTFQASRNNRDKIWKKATSC